MTEQTQNTPLRVAEVLFTALKRHDFDTAWNNQHPDIVDDFVAIGEYRGRDAVRGFFEELFAAFPDFDVDVVDMVSDGEVVVVQWHATGTFSGASFQGVHATGRRVEQRGCDVMRFEGGKLRHNTIYYDGLAFARHMGLLPRAGSAADKAMTAAFNATTDLRSRLHARREPAHAS